MIAPAVASWPTRLRVAASNRQVGRRRSRSRATTGTRHPASTTTPTVVPPARVHMPAPDNSATATPRPSTATSPTYALET